LPSSSHNSNLRRGEQFDYQAERGIVVAKVENFLSILYHRSSI
jgi:hypothetical protein